ncbi:hypothetical protein N7G274_005313 [Stereocaulon virgatum]|uniref:Uncharacterized protein n=1 Tax=Stereocaulon virgatum TaxID=373712 RepID=A0ABR4A8K7_9LECA
MSTHGSLSRCDQGFQGYSREITEAILGRPRNPLQMEIRAVDRGLPCAPKNGDIDDLLASFEALTRIYNEDQGLLPRDSPLSSIKTLAYMAGRTHRLATALLEMSINQAIDIQPAPPRPLPSAGFLFSVKSLRNHRESLHDTSRHKYPASECAEFRIVRALWRLQLYTSSRLALQYL